MDIIEQRLTDLAAAGREAARPMATAMVDPLYAQCVAIEALEEIRRRHMLNFGYWTIGFVLGTVCGMAAMWIYLI